MPGVPSVSYFLLLSSSSRGMQWMCGLPPRLARSAICSAIFRALRSCAALISSLDGLSPIARSLLLRAERRLAVLPPGTAVVVVVGVLAVPKRLSGASARDLLTVAGLGLLGLTAVVVAAHRAAPLGGLVHSGRAAGCMWPGHRPAVCGSRRWAS